MKKPTFFWVISSFAIGILLLINVWLNLTYEIQRTPCSEKRPRPDPDCIVSDRYIYKFGPFVYKVYQEPPRTYEEMTQEFFDRLSRPAGK